MTYQWERNGDEFSFTWPQAGIGIGFEQIYDGRGDLYADMWVQSLLAMQEGHVHWGRLNLSSTSAREKLAKSLNGRIKEIAIDEWTKMLEVACTKTAQEFRKGEPIVNLAQLPLPKGSAYLVKRLLPLNVTTILFGDGGTAKSMISLWLAIAVKTGLALPCGLHPTMTKNVMYLDWETYQDDQVERVHALAEGLGLDDVPDIHYRRMKRPLAEDVARLRTEVDRLRIGFLIVDSLGFAAGGNLKENDIALGVMDALGKIGVTTLAIAHITKEAAKEETGRATPFGSAFFSFAARSTWEIRKANEGEEHEINVGIFHRKANRGPLQRTPIGLKIEFENDELEPDRLQCVTINPYSVAEDAELAPHSSMSYRLREALRKANGKPMSVEELARELGIEAKKQAKSMSRTLRRMKDVVNLTEARGRGGLAMYALKAL